MRQVQTDSNNFYSEYTSIARLTKVRNSRGTAYFTYSKRTLDLFISILALPIVLVILGIFCILIRLESPGSAFYFQERVGKNGQYFKIVKLRSMYMNAEENGAVWATKDDQRITRIGKFIRKRRIDELPQLYNVIKGEMSIVGPRPERPKFTAEFERKHSGFVQRLLVNPGITGWAQVNGGYELSPKEKMNLDFYYISNKSILLDIKIILKTIKVVLTGAGAR